MDRVAAHAEFSNYRIAYPKVCRHTCTDPGGPGDPRVPLNTVHNEGSNIAFCDGHAKWWHHRKVIPDWGILYDGR